MGKLEFTIPGEPHGKGRPRFVRATGRTYTDRATASYENLVRVAFKNAYPDWVPSPDAVEVHIYSYFPIPMSWSKKKQTAALLGWLRKVSKPDLDNVQKAVLDGLNGIAWKDDAQIVTMFASKKYDEEPRADVTIIFLEE